MAYLDATQGARREGTAGAISAADLATDSVAAAEIAAGSVGSSELAALAVETAAIAAGAVTRAKQSAAAMRKSIQANSATIATTSTTDIYVIVPETGTLDGVDFSAIDALAAHDSNYITFSIVNLGQAGAGTAVMLAATDANTTKATGGTALSANTKRSLTLTGTAADLNVTAGDRLRVRATATGTLANTVTGPVYLLRFGGTT